MQERDMSERLRKDSLVGYSTGVKDPVYAEAVKTLSLLQMAFTHRSGKRSAEIPLTLVQSISTLSILGFDHAGGFQIYKQGVPSALDKIWLLYTTTLIHFVRTQREKFDEPIFFGCFEIPNWFVEESRALPVFKYFD